MAHRLPVITLKEQPPRNERPPEYNGQPLPTCWPTPSVAADKRPRATCCPPSGVPARADPRLNEVASLRSGDTERKPEIIASTPPPPKRNLNLINFGLEVRGRLIGRGNAASVRPLMGLARRTRSGGGLTPSPPERSTSSEVPTIGKGREGREMQPLAASVSQTLFGCGPKSALGLESTRDPNCNNKPKRTTYYFLRTCKMFINFRLKILSFELSFQTFET